MVFDSWVNDRTVFAVIIAIYFYLDYFMNCSILIRLIGQVMSSFENLTHSKLRTNENSSRDGRTLHTKILIYGAMRMPRDQEKHLDGIEVAFLH